MLQIGGMALELTADLQPIAQEHRSQLSDQLLSGITGLAKGATEIALEARGMAGGMDLARLTASQEVGFSVGIRTSHPSSSVLSVLLGRLAAEDPCGQASFDGVIQIQCMNSTVQAMANVVVLQRLNISSLVCMSSSNS